MVVATRRRRNRRVAVAGVFARAKAGEMLGELHLMTALGKVEVATQPRASRVRLEQLVDVGNADSAKHGFALFSSIRVCSASW